MASPMLPADMAATAANAASMYKNPNPTPMPMRPDMATPPPPMAMRGPGRKAVGMGPNRAKGGPIKAKKYAKGGSVSSRADGCCTKGKTKGKMM